VIAAIEHRALTMEFGVDGNGNRFVLAAFEGRVARVYPGAIKRNAGASGEGRERLLGADFMMYIHHSYHGRLKPLPAAIRRRLHAGCGDYGGLPLSSPAAHGPRGHAPL